MKRLLIENKDQTPDTYHYRRCAPRQAIRLNKQAIAVAKLPTGGKKSLAALDLTVAPVVNS
jgi:hypothetical protein